VIGLVGTILSVTIPGLIGPRPGAEFPPLNRVLRVFGLLSYVGQSDRNAIRLGDFSTYAGGYFQWAHCTGWPSLGSTGLFDGTAAERRRVLHAAALLLCCAHWLERGAWLVTPGTCKPYSSPPTGTQ